MKKSFLIAAALGYALIASHGYAENGKLTFAIVGDWPYSLDLVAAAPLLIESAASSRWLEPCLEPRDLHAVRPVQGSGRAARL